MKVVFLEDVEGVALGGDIKEVKNGFECGLMLENYSDIKVADIIEIEYAWKTDALPTELLLAYRNCLY